MFAFNTVPVVLVVSILFMQQIYSLPSPRIKYFADEMELSINCQKNGLIQIKSIKWIVKRGRNIDSLTQEEKIVFSFLNKPNNDLGNTIITSCNGKNNCVTTISTGHTKPINYLELKVEYFCHFCPHGRFVAKHIVPDEYNGNLPEFAKHVEQLRCINRWQQTNVNTIFTDATHMEYTREQAQCSFNTPAPKYQCKKKCKNEWNCDPVGSEIAYHDTLTGHYYMK